MIPFQTTRSIDKHRLLDSRWTLPQENEKEEEKKEEKRKTYKVPKQFLSANVIRKKIQGMGKRRG